MTFLRNSVYLIRVVVELFSLGTGNIWNIRLEGNYLRDEAFQDRLSKFTANKSQFLYSSTKDPTGDHAGHEDNGGVYAVLPPLETFLDIPGHLRKRHFYEHDLTVSHFDGIDKSSADILVVGSVYM
ncbi:hypothetical protein LSH36_325g03037 [Paralvinella palmiformis]|uniref:Uncharacterized protein n=1 Tax=Paralvinella palmiformis TaxID=53620 RepID=A0AAD9JH43_9ANNE|nr:hypothetical protein LSH36_325g03037 [Paralvinella palmiformis]